MLYIIDSCVTTCHITNKGGDTMPSQTFLNLDSNKQKKLLDAAMEEFSRVSYTDSSINQIIQNAGISRGSFYTYFIDKDDLFGYLLELNKKKFFALTKEIFVSCKGDIRTSFLMLYDVFTKKIEENMLAGFLKNIFIYFNFYREKFEIPGHSLFLYVKDSISTNHIISDNLEFVFHVFMHDLLSSITEAVKNDNILDVRKQYENKINILCYGIYREEEEC